jgi:hypothetical protein
MLWCYAGRTLCLAGCVPSEAIGRTSQVKPSEGEGCYNFDSSRAYPGERGEYLYERPNQSMRLSL